MPTAAAAIAAGFAAALAVKGVAVTYLRGEGEIPIALAIFGRTEWEAPHRDGFVEKFTSVDVLIPPADLVVDSVLIEPEKGDQIQRTQGDVVRTYEVLGQPGIPPARIDNDRTFWRVHTKLIGEAPVEEDPE